jgi:hypothetical protein
MSIFMGRDGSISLIRVALAIALVGILFIGGALLSFVIDQGSRQAPLEIEPFPGAEPMGEIPGGSPTARSLIFRVRDATPEQVADYYQQKLTEFSGDDPQECARIPRIGSYPEAEGRNDVVPFQYICHFDRSGFRTTQYTKVKIQPGIFSAVPEDNTLGYTMIEHEQRWQP